MRPRTIELLATLALGILLAPLAVDAQQPSKMYRIGFLSGRSGPSNTDEAFRQGLRDLGYVEGKNIAIEYRWAHGNIERLPALAADLIRLRVDVIVTGSTPAVQAAKNATKTIPIVIAAAADPIGTGLVATLARPGGNVTGLTIVSPELSGKRLELLREAVPRVSRVAILAHRGFGATALLLKEAQSAALILGMQVQPLEVRGPGDFEAAFAAMTRERASALLVQANPVFFDHRKRIVDLAAGTAYRPSTRSGTMWMSVV